MQRFGSQEAISSYQELFVRGLLNDCANGDRAQESLS
jgi:hypothetical protein